MASAFDKQVQESVMDITGDDSQVLKKQNSMQKWDRKKKKFVNVGQVHIHRMNDSQSVL